jgi:hypothetical protein
LIHQGLAARLDTVCEVCNGRECASVNGGAGGLAGLKISERPPPSFRPFFGLNGYSSGSATNLTEANHVPFFNHHLFASHGDHHHCYSKQYAFGFQVFHLELSDVDYRLDFLFLSHWWSNRGGFGFTKAGDEILSCKEHEQGNE